MRQARLCPVLDSCACFIVESQTGRLAAHRRSFCATDEVKWNFTRFLVGRDGTVIKRYEPPSPPANIKADLENYL